MPTFYHFLNKILIISLSLIEPENVKEVPTFYHFLNKILIISLSLIEPENVKEEEERSSSVENTETTEVSVDSIPHVKVGQLIEFDWDIQGIFL